MNNELTALLIAITFLVAMGLPKNKNKMTMEVVKIRWIDSCASNMHWSLMDEFDGDIEPIEIISFGVLIKETEECITIAQNYGINPHQCCSLMTIPKGCIKEKVLIEKI